MLLYFYPFHKNERNGFDFIVFYFLCLNFLNTYLPKRKFSNIPKPINIVNTQLHVIVESRNILFGKLSWPGDSEGTPRSSSQAAFFPPAYLTWRRVLTLPLIAERLAGKL